MKRNKIILFMLLLSTFGIAKAATETSVTITQEMLNNNKYKEGYSSWSTQVPSNVDNYVSGYAYVSASGGEFELQQMEKTSSKPDGTDSTYVWYVSNEKKYYQSKKKKSSTYCKASADNNSYRGDCGGENGWNCSFKGGNNWSCDNDSCCAYSTGEWSCTRSFNIPCGSWETAHASCPGSERQNCYAYRIGKNETSINWVCDTGSEYSTSGDHDCASQTKYDLISTNEYDVSKFYLNLSETFWAKAGQKGYGKKVKIYSYPLRTYINYNGNGADGACNDGNVTANWTKDSSGKITYSLGNPVCNGTSTADITNKGGTMKGVSELGASNSAAYLQYSVAGNLRENEYYRIGYDFKGWSLTPNGTVKWADKASVKGSDLSSLGGATVTLYAVWEKHTYNITFSAACGSATSQTYKYQGDAVTLSSWNSNTNCSIETKFLGWYETLSSSGTYSNPVGSTLYVSDRYRDLTLYARLRQQRKFDYSQGKWVEASVEEGNQLENYDTQKK